MADTDDDAAPQENPYAVSLADLERGVHVPGEDQSTEQSTRPVPPTWGEVDEARRQFGVRGAPLPGS